MIEVQGEEKPIIHICGSPWGIGGYMYIDENGKKQSGYGYYKPQNPNDFYPDYECCTKEEIAAHKAACEEWNKGCDPEKKESSTPAE